MTGNDPKANARTARLLQKIDAEAREEFEAGIRLLKSRDDYLPAYEYFLGLLPRALHPAKLKEAVSRQVVEHLCNQAPYELFHAFGTHPFKKAGGCHAVQRLCDSAYPALMCPMMKSTLGMTRLQPGEKPESNALVVPTTCDWAVSFPGANEKGQDKCLMMELPHVREGEKARRRWLEEVYGLAFFLEKITGKKLKKVSLAASVITYNQARQVLGELIAMRRRGIIAGVWFTAVVSSFTLDAIETWTDRLRLLINDLATQTPDRRTPGLFLAGSPIIFPNLKLLHLISEAGMDVRADDLCSSERILPGIVCHEDATVHGLMRALSESYHQGCICPTFADNERRINSILNTLTHHNLHGVIYHVLKGCHPCDMESVSIEKQLKQKGYKFLRIETDYTDEDGRNILTRLEAFREL